MKSNTFRMLSLSVAITATAGCSRQGSESTGAQPTAAPAESESNYVPVTSTATVQAGISPAATAADPSATITPVVTATAATVVPTGLTCEALIGKWYLNDPDAPGTLYHEYRANNRFCINAFNGNDTDCPDIEACAADPLSGVITMKLRRKPQSDDLRFCTLRVAVVNSAQLQYERRCAQAAFPTITTSPLKYTKM